MSRVRAGILVCLALLVGAPHAVAGVLDELRAPNVPDGRVTPLAAAGRVVHVELLDARRTPRGEEHDVRAEINYLPHFSGHADRTGLIKFAKATSPDRLKKIFLVHGEVDQAQALKKALHEEGFGAVHIPAPGEEFNI